jgi:hypothetical protein
MTLEELGEAERQLIRYQSNINWNRAEIKPLQIQAIIICHKIFSQSNKSRHTLMYLIYHEELMNHTFSSRCGSTYCRNLNLVLFCIETFCRDISNVLSSCKHLRVFIRSLELVDTNRFTSYDLLTIAKCTLKILANLHPQSLGSQPVGCRDSEIWDIYNRMLMFFPKLIPDSCNRMYVTFISRDHELFLKYGFEKPIMHSSVLNDSKTTKA